MSRTDRIPGIPSQSEVALLAIISRLEKRLDGLEKGPTSPPIITGDFQAKEGQYVRVAAPSGGLNLTFPEARASNRGSKITVSFETQNAVYLRAVNGLVNRQSYVATTLIGTFDAVSDGESGWAVALGASDSGSGLDAEFFTGAAHSSISNERVARDSLSVRVDRTTPGFVSWDAPWSGVLAEGPTSGPNNPVIDAGQYLQFGYYPGNGTGQIRSHEVGGLYITPDATLGLQGGSTVEIAAGTNVTIDAANTIDIDAVNGTTLTGGGLAVDVTFQVDLKAGSFVSVDPFLKFVTEHAASTPSMSAGQALLWIKDNAPNTPKYTDDTNTDFDIPLGVSSTSVTWDGTSRTFQRPALTGDLTASANSNATTIANDAVTNAKLANIATPRLKGRTTASTGDPEDLTLTNATSITWNTSSGGAISVERAALTGAVTATANSNTTAFGAISAKSVLANTTNASAVPAASAPSTLLQALRANAANNALEWAGIGAAVETTAGSVTNSTGIIDLTGGLTIPASTLAVGSRFKASGLYRFTRGSTATALNLNSSLDVSSSSLAVVSASANTTNGFSGTVRVDAEFTVVTTGAAGTARANIVTTTDCDNTATAAKVVTAFNATFAVDTTASLTMKLRASMSGTVANTTILATGGEILRVA